MTLDFDSFQMWYVEPLHALEQLPDGRGGFIALATSCFLYERYVTALLKSQNKKADTSAKVKQLASDFGVDSVTAEAFWNVIRDGILHQAMPMQKKQERPLMKWAFHHLYPVMSLENIQGVPWLKVQPWKFMNKVINLWEDNFSLLAESDSFPWASIGPVPG